MTPSEETRAQAIKTLIILRGLPGSGKSTYAATLGGVVLSSDDYFMVGGTYRFDGSRLGIAHEWNQDRCRKALAAGEPLVVIDNTNTRRWEMGAYRSMAKAADYKVRLVEMEEKDPAVCAARTTHGVPFETVLSMSLRWEAAK